MSDFAMVEGHGVQLVGCQEHQLASGFAARYACHKTMAGDVQIVLQADQHGISCWWHNNVKKPLHLRIDIEHFLQRNTSFPAPRKGIWNRALGKKTVRILDLTGGWGNDALLLAGQGYQVDVIERHPLMALLLQDAMLRLAKSRWAQISGTYVPRILEVDACDHLPSLMAGEGDQYDCLYLDPMFPAKRKSSAKPAKELQFLQWMLGPQADAQLLAEAAVQSGAKRVVIKRPHYAEPLIDNPSDRFSGKLVHYDVYLRNGGH